MTQNPLATSKQKTKAPQAAAPMPALLAHAKVWQHVNSMPPDQIAQKTDVVDYLIPVLGALAAKSNVTAKDVIKATADAVADNQIEPSEGVKFITQIPEKQEDIRPWLKGLYALNLTGAVHMKAALLQQQQGAPQAAAAQPIAAAPGTAPTPAQGAMP